MGKELDPVKNVTDAGTSFVTNSYHWTIDKYQKQVKPDQHFAKKAWGHTWSRLACLALTSVGIVMTVTNLALSVFCKLTLWIAKKLEICPDSLIKWLDETSKYHTIRIYTTAMITGVSFIGIFSPTKAAAINWSRKESNNMLNDCDSITPINGHRRRVDLTPDGLIT